MDVFVCDSDHEVGKIIKHRKPNPIGENIYLEVDGLTITRDEDKIIKAQRIFMHNHYKPGGVGARRVIDRLLGEQKSGSVHDSEATTDEQVTKNKHDVHSLPLPVQG